MTHDQIFPNFQTGCFAKMIGRKINAIASIWGENMLGYLSSKLSVFLSESRLILRTDDVSGQIVCVQGDITTFPTLKLRATKCFNFIRHKRH